jgi:putative heme iron utilization protein
VRRTALIIVAVGCGATGPGGDAGTDTGDSTEAVSGSGDGSSGSVGSRGSEGSEGSDGSDGSGAESDGSSDTGDGDDPVGWRPPIGIPVPEFGIDDDCGNNRVITTSDTAALTEIPAGTTIELEGGPYSGDALTISGQGTADAPICVRSKDPNKPVVLTFDVAVSGRYLILEYLEFDQGLGDRAVSVTGDHIAVRHSEIHGFRPGHFSTTFYVYAAEHVVLYDSEIHDNGDFGIVGEHDVHGIGGSSVRELWIVDNHLHHNRGDSIQFGHQAGNVSSNIYVGRNQIHDDGENCIDIKETSNVVASENDLHAAGGEVAIVFHDCPINAAAIYNEIHDTGVGVSLPSLEDACLPHTPIELFVTRNEFSSLTVGVEAWNTGKRYLIAGNAFASVGSPLEVENASPDSIVSVDDDRVDEVFAAFEAVYGIDISEP